MSVPRDVFENGVGFRKPLTASSRGASGVSVTRLGGRRHVDVCRAADSYDAFADSACTPNCARRDRVIAAMRVLRAGRALFLDVGDLAVRRDFPVAGRSRSRSRAS